MRLVAYLVWEEDGVEKYELIDMQGRVLKDKKDAARWLFYEAPKRPDLDRRRIDIVDADEPLDKAH